MKQMTLVLTIILWTLLSFGQSNDLPNRESFKLKLAVDSINFYESDIKSSPYVLQKDIIQIYPGEKIYVEIELDKKEIKSIKTVKENQNPEKTLTISFEQETKGRFHNYMMLTLENPFNFELEYKAMIFLMKQNIWTKTNVLDIPAKLLSYESWPDIIVTIALSDWKYK